MKGIIFETQENIKTIILSEIKFDYSGYSDSVTFKIKVNHEIYCAETILEAEEYDFIRLKEDLTAMYNLKQKYAFFRPIDNYLQINFSLLETGIIEVKIELNNPLFTGKLLVEFNSDVSFLPKIIASLEDVLSNNKVKL